MPDLWYRSFGWSIYLACVDDAVWYFWLFQPHPTPLQCLVHLTELFQLLGQSITHHFFKRTMSFIRDVGLNEQEKTYLGADRWDAPEVSPPKCTLIRL
jgi:hypothetical protein